MPSLADAVRAMAHGALIGARGNSGTILAQLLRGMAQVLAEEQDRPHTDGKGLGLALRHAADSARQAVAHPVEGTVLSVASAAADAARTADGDCGTVAGPPTGARARPSRGHRPSCPSWSGPAWSTRAGAGWSRCWGHWWRR